MLGGAPNDTNMDTSIGDTHEGAKGDGSASPASSKSDDGATRSDETAEVGGPGEPSEKQAVHSGASGARMLGGAPKVSSMVTGSEGTSAGTLTGDEAAAREVDLCDPVASTGPESRTKSGSASGSATNPVTSVGEMTTVEHVAESTPTAKHSSPVTETPENVALDANLQAQQKRWAMIKNTVEES